MLKLLTAFLVKKTKNTKWLHRLLSTIYRVVVLPFSSGYVKRKTLYNFKVKGKEVNALKKHGFKKIKPFLSHSWRWGMGSDNAFRRYYSAELNGEPVFVKVAINDSTIWNEIKIAKYMRDLELPFLIKTIKTDISFSGNKQMMSILFIEGLHDLTPPQTEQELVRYCNEFSDILDTLQVVGIVHADIHPKNLMLGEDNHLILLDFGISGIVDNENEVNYIARCGTYFIEKDGIRVYDDAYSFVKMIENMKLPQSWLNNPSLAKIKERIGINILKVSLENGRTIT